MRDALTRAQSWIVHNPRTTVTVLLVLLMLIVAADPAAAGDVDTLGGSAGSSGPGDTTSGD